MMEPFGLLMGQLHEQTFKIQAHGAASVRDPHPWCRDGILQRRGVWILCLLSGNDTRSPRSACHMVEATAGAGTA